MIFQSFDYEDYFRNAQCALGLISMFLLRIMVRVMMFNATFNNITAISWRTVLLVEQTGVREENRRPAQSH